MLQHVSVCLDLSRKQVTVKPPKALPLNRLFSGANQAQVLDKLRLLFPVCKAAHCIAVLGAFESFENKTVSTSVLSQRNLLVNLEALHEQIWLLCIELPRLFGMPDKVIEFASLSQKIKRHCNHALSQLLDLDKENKGVHQTQVSGQLDQGMMVLRDINSFYKQQFLAKTDGLRAALLTRIRALNWEQTMDEAPDLLGLFEKSGEFIESRLSERVVSSIEQVTTEQNIIISSVETARGQLKYTLELHKLEGETSIEMIESYSPTDQHFGLKGDVYQLLSEMLKLDLELSLERAQLLVRLFNPCCAYEVSKQ